MENMPRRHQPPAQCHPSHRRAERAVDGEKREGRPDLGKGVWSGLAHLVRRRYGASFPGGLPVRSVFSWSASAELAGTRLASGLGGDRPLPRISPLAWTE